MGKTVPIQTAALLAHRSLGGDRSEDTGHISPAGETTLLWTRALDLKLHQGNRQYYMWALECPCQSKGGGILNDPSCWLTLDVRWRGVSKKCCFFFVFFLKLMVSAMPFPVNRDSASPSGMHVQIGLSHMISRGSYSMPFLSIWLAAISMTLMMNAMAKAQMRLFLTHVWRFFFEGWTEMKMKKNRILKHK